MIAIHFGHFCFNKPEGEQSIIIVLASKKEYSSMDDFVTKALIYLESKERIYSPVDDEEKKWMRSRLDDMDRLVNIAYEKIISAVHIIAPEWNDITLGIETESEYIFYQWGTSA